jgi:phospholipid transport system substrate-binding protein
MHAARIAFILLLSFASVLLVPAVATADAQSERFIKDRQAELTTALRKGDRAKVDEVFDVMIDYKSIARDSLGEHWDRLKNEQRTQFICILRNLVSDAYRRDLEKTLNYEVRYKGSSKVERGHLVKTVATSKTDKREEPISIDYVVHQVGDKLMVRDILTEDSSLVGNYNAQFRRIIKKKGFDALIEKMEKKLGDRAKACRPKPRHGAG